MRTTEDPNPPPALQTTPPSHEADHDPSASPLSRHSDSTAPSLGSSKQTSLSSPTHSDWEEDSDLGGTHGIEDSDEYDLIASRDFGGDGDAASTAGSSISGLSGSGVLSSRGGSQRGTTEGTPSIISSLGRSSASSDDDGEGEDESGSEGRMKLSFPDPMKAFTEGEAGSETTGTDVSASEDEGDDGKAEGEAEYSMLLDAMAESSASIKAPGEAMRVGNSKNGNLQPTLDASREVENGEHDHDLDGDDERDRGLDEDLTPAASKLVEASFTSLSSHLEVGGGGAAEGTPAVDIEAWVRLTGGAASRTAPSSIACAERPQPDVLASAAGSTDTLSVRSPRTASLLPQASAFKRRRGGGNASPSTPGSEITSRFIESERERPSSAARYTAPTLKETTETAASIKAKLEQLAAASASGKDDRNAAGGVSKSKAIFVALTAAAVLVAAAAALADPSGTGGGSGLGYLRRRASSSGEVPTTVTNSLAMVSAAQDATSPTSLAAVVQPVEEVVNVINPAVVEVETQDLSAVASLTAVHQIQHSLQESLHASADPLSATSSSPSVHAAVEEPSVTSCSLSNPAACALALIDTRTALAVSFYNHRPNLSLFGIGADNSTPPVGAKTKRASLCKQRKKLRKCPAPCDSCSSKRANVDRADAKGERRRGRKACLQGKCATSAASEPIRKAKGPHQRRAKCAKNPFVRKEDNTRSRHRRSSSQDVFAVLPSSLDEVVLSLREASSVVLDRAQERIHRFQKEKVAPAARTTRHLRHWVTSDARTTEARQLVAGLRHEADKKLEDVKAIIGHAQKELLSQLRASEKEVTLWVGERKKEGRARVYRAARAYGMLRRGEVGFDQEGKIMLKGCGELEAPLRRRCETMRRRTATLA